MTLDPAQADEFVAQIRVLAEASNRPGQSLAVAVETLRALTALPIHQGRMVGGVGLCAPDCAACLINRLADAVEATIGTKR